MRAILDHCHGMPVQDIPAGTIILAEGQNTGHAYVLVQGRVEVLRGDVQVAVCDEPGALFGEMSILLGGPHTATVRALGETRLHVIDDGRAFFRENPPLLWLVGHLLANRLNAATSYLADLKHQYADHGTHLEMVGEVLEAMLFEQERDFRPGSARDPGRA